MDDVVWALSAELVGDIVRFQEAAEAQPLAVPAIATTSASAPSPPERPTSMTASPSPSAPPSPCAPT